MGQASAKNPDRPGSYPHGTFEEAKSSEVLQRGGKSGKAGGPPAGPGSGPHPLCGGKLPKAFERSDCPACRRLPLLDVMGESESSSAGPSGTDRPSWFRSEMAVAWPRGADWVLTVTASHPWRAHTVGSQVVPSHSRLVTAQWRWLLQGGSRDSEASTYPQPARMESCRQPSAHVHVHWVGLANKPDVGMAGCWWQEPRE